MSSYKHRVRRLFQRAGIDLQRYPQSDIMWRVARLLRSREIDLVIDVGANDGGYARSLREHGYTGRLRSFEPLSEPFRRLEQHARTDAGWVVERLALGSGQGEIDINVAGNDAASSSVLPMKSRHVAAAPASAYVGTETVALRRLDDVLDGGVGLEGQRSHLKIDVQGFERDVLEGAAQTLASPWLVGLQLELSLVELYEGGMLWQEGLDRAVGMGFDLVGVLPGFADFDTGQTLQFDGIFMRG